MRRDERYGRYHSRKKRRRSRIVIASAMAVMAVLVVILVITVIKGGKKIPANTDVVSSSVEQSESSLIETSSAVSSGPTSSELEEQRLFQERYERAKGVLLANFTHPNYKDPDDLVYLKDVLGNKYKINASYFQLSHDAAYALKEMLDAASEDGITTFIINSAYRDRKQQQEFWDNRLKKDPTYGDDVYSNPVKTVPATASEHCTGLATDILCESVPHGTSDYKDTKEAKWLEENAWKYGFILRYPEDSTHITGVMYEPWHYRYVGKEVAKDIHESGLCLEAYLESLGLPLEDNDETPNP